MVSYSVNVTEIKSLKTKCVETFANEELAYATIKNNWFTIISGMNEDVADKVFITKEQNDKVLVYCRYEIVNKGVLFDATEYKEDLEYILFVNESESEDISESGFNKQVLIGEQLCELFSKEKGLAAATRLLTDNNHIHFNFESNVEVNTVYFYITFKIYKKQKYTFDLKKIIIY